MDPNEALLRIREECRAVLSYINDDDAEAAASHGVDLVELVEGLDNWLVSGGYMPAAWAALRAVR